MLAMFKKKTPVEDLIHQLAKHKIPKALEFFHSENDHARVPLVVNEKLMREMGGGMCLFFLAEYLPESKPGNQAKMGRAYTQLKKEFRPQGLNPQKSYDMWKSFTDALLLHENVSRVDLAERLSWEKLFPDRKHVAKTALHAFCYFLYLQVQDAGKVKLS